MRSLTPFRIVVVLLLAACGGELPPPEVPEVAQHQDALCSCSFRFEYRVPVVENLCSTGKGGVVICSPVTIVHTVVCQNQCIACGTMTCTDLTAGTTTTRPDDQYQVSSEWFACNSRNTCS